jgi:glc operon protein GlcG
MADGPEATDSVAAPFGRPVELSDARTVIAAVRQAATERGWAVSVAVLDLGGKLVALERMDRAMMASPEVAVAKAMGAIAFKRPTKMLQEAIVSGFTPMLSLSFVGMVPIEGGLPILKDGEIIGAVGVSGQSPTGDAELAEIGLGAIT